MKRYILLFLLSLIFFCQSAFAKVSEILPVCSAAVHAGLISTTKGGSFLATIEHGQSHYQGSNQNGVTSQGYYAHWFGSYRLSALDNAQSPNFTLAYDAAGNITQKGDVSLTYNQGNRLATASQSNLVAEYRYNAEGVRSSKTVNGKHTDYIYSGGRLLAWKDNQGWHENIYLNGEIIATVDNGQIHYHENDYQGKALRLVNEQGNTVWTADWQPYRTSDKPQNGINNPQRFAGQILDEETGLYYNHFREYDPQTGRYTQSDPIGLSGGVNTYAYVGGNPIDFVDPLGLDTVGEVIDEWGGHPDNGPVSHALAAIVSAIWDVFGAEGISEIADGKKEITAKNICWELGMIAGGKYVKPVKIAKATKVSDTCHGGMCSGIGEKVNVPKETAKSSRAARREAMRKTNTPTSRSATEQSGSNGRRQYIVEGSDGKPRVISQHPADKDHPKPHWHSSTPKTDPLTGDMLRNRHGQVKYKSGGPSVPYGD